MCIGVTHLEVLAPVLTFCLLEVIITCVGGCKSVVGVDSCHGCVIGSGELGGRLLFGGLILVGQVQKVAKATAVTSNAVARFLEW